MVRIEIVAKFMVLLGVVVGMTGCASLDKLHTTMDMAASRIAAPGELEHEGRFVAAERFGAMTAIQLEGGRQFDVEHAPPALSSGDIVRIYKTSKGYTAHLWRRHEEPTVAINVPSSALSSSTPVSNQKTR